MGSGSDRFDVLAGQRLLDTPVHARCGECFGALRQQLGSGLDQRGILGAHHLQHGDHALVTPHTLIVTGANSRVSVVEDFRSSEDDILALSAVEILPGPGAEVRYTALHRWGTKTRVLNEQRTITERDSAVYGLSLAVGGAVVKSHIESSLVGRGSSSELFGLGVANALVEAELNPSAEAVAASLSAADSTAGAIEAVDLGILGAAFADEQGVALRDDLAALLGADELAAKLAPGLSALNQRARSLVLGTVAAPGAERADRPGAAGAHPAPAPAPAVAIVETLPGTAGGPLAASGAGVSTVLGRQGLSRIEAQAALGKLIADLDDDRYTDRRFDVEVVMRDGSAG